MDHEIEQIILRNLSGEASCEDILAFSEWLSSSDAHKDSFLKIKKYWDAEVAGVKLRNPEAAYNMLLERIRKTERKKEVRQLWMKYAGAAAVAIIIGIAGYWMGEHQTTAPMQYYSYITGNSISSFELPDGTEISLNKTVNCLIPVRTENRFAKSLWMGKVSFTVTKDKEKAFVVDLNGSKNIRIGNCFQCKELQEGRHNNSNFG